MKISTLLSLVLLSATSQSFGQTNPMQAFQNQIGGIWTAEGKQLGGQDGKTTHQFEWGLGGKIVKVKSYTTDPKTMKFGLRNEGIRAYNANEESIQFYEFDKLGGITTGNVLIEGNDIHYNYDYQGMKLRDTWKYVSVDSYRLIVGVWLDGNWSQKFHEAVFTRQ